MSLEFTAIPLAFLAGLLGIMSPCVWPLVPVVMSSAATSGRSGPWFLALGLATAFAVAGTFLTLLMLNLGLHPDVLRYLAAGLLILIALVLLVKPLENWISLHLSLLSGRLNGGGGSTGSGVGQFGVGALLGLVWLPCVGPTLGAAIALASMGKNISMAFAVMFTFGAGTASVLLFAGLASGKLLNRWRPGIMINASRGKKLLGTLLLALGIMVITGFDKVLETWALNLLPQWAINL
jgi:cytochrome c biogenesis protein CcdA